MSPHPAISRLTLTDFRNYDSLRLEPPHALVVLAGANGAGKTNLLEAISLLTPGRGLRGVEFPQLARLGGSGAWAVAATLVTAHDEIQIGTAWRPDEDGEPPPGRTVMIDGIQQKSAGVLADVLRIIWLTPAMDRLFTGSPGDRRRFLDRMVALFDASHGARVAAFEKLMRERNLLLQEASPDRIWLSGLETQMAESGIAIAAARLDAMLVLARHTSAAPRLGLFPWSNLSITGDTEALVSRHPAVEAEDMYRKALSLGRMADRAAGRALQGPHRSDLKVVHGPKQMPAENCSTGEQKALLTGLILAQAQATKTLFGAAPILLLDEIAAHLDAKRRESLFGLLESLQSQCFMTGTEAQLFDGAGPSTVVYQVDNGHLSESKSNP